MNTSRRGWEFFGLVALALAVAGVPMDASADITLPDQGQALAACEAAGPRAKNVLAANGYNPTEWRCTVNTTSRFYRCQVKESGAWIGCGNGSEAEYYYWEQGGTCASRNTDLGDPQRAYVGALPSCVAGCAIGHGAVVETTVNGEKFFSTSNTQYTGSTCTASPSEPDIPEPGPETPDTQKVCTPAGNGQTACVKPNGDYCATASTGLEFCWTPTQTGEQATGTNLQRRTTGANRPSNPPATPPPPDAAWNPNSSHTTNSPQNGAFTIINYSTTPGDAGHTDTGGVTGPSTPGGDEGEDDGISAGGGGTCASPPTCTKPGAVECVQLINTWYLRCKGVDLTGGDTCAVPPTCTGNAGDCHISRSLFLMRCGEVGEGIGAGLESALAEAEAEVFGEGEEPPDGEYRADDDGTVLDSVREVRGGSWLADQLDDSGFISSAATCPLDKQVTAGAASFSLSFAPLCDTLINMSGIIMALAYVMAFRIIAN